MTFNSLEFILFLPAVLGLYWALNRSSLAIQNTLLILASYLFYGWWDYRFLSLIIVSSATDFLAGLALSRALLPSRRRALLVTSLAVNLGILGFFKYFNFFIGSLADALRSLGLEPNLFSLQLVLPVGISFYTFQTMSYTIDVYRRRIEPTSDIWSFFAFVSFFPQLVAGPIERAKDLLPQFRERREFDIHQASDGLRQMLWGFLKKILIADNLAPQVEYIFADYSDLDGLLLITGALLFAIQIYCDFSGYSDIAIGTARLFGFNLRRNFAYPYFARDIAEFWRRWHISLSTWFRDYVYIPLGGSYTAKRRRIFNVLATFGLSGLWHGSNWTFVFWGLLNGLYYIPLMLKKRAPKARSGAASATDSSQLRDLPAISLNFSFTLLAWIFFRSESLSDAFGFIVRIFQQPVILGAGLDHSQYAWPLALSLLFTTLEWLQRDKQHPLQVPDLPRSVRWCIYLTACLTILLFGNFNSVAFIYFQF